MFDGIRDRWNNRESRCLKCQKKLVVNEKYLCKKCKTDMGIAGEVTAGALLLYGLTKIPKVIKHFKA